MCLIVLGQTALCGVLRVIHCTSILLSLYCAVGPLIKHLMSFFFLYGGRECWGLNDSGPPTCKSSSLPLSCTPRPRTFSILRSPHHHQTSSRKAYQQQSLLLKRNSRGCAKPAGEGLLLSSKRDVSEPLPTTPVSTAHHPGCELPVQQPVRVAGATARQRPGFLSRGPGQAGRAAGVQEPGRSTPVQTGGAADGGGLRSASHVGKVQATVEAGLAENGEHHSPVLA